MIVHSSSQFLSISRNILSLEFSFSVQFQCTRLHASTKLKNTSSETWNSNNLQAERVWKMQVFSNISTNFIKGLCHRASTNDSVNYMLRYSCCLISFDRVIRKRTRRLGRSSKRLLSRHCSLSHGPITYLMHATPTDFFFHSRITVWT